MKKPNIVRVMKMLADVLKALAGRNISSQNGKDLWKLATSTKVFLDILKIFIIYWLYVYVCMYIKLGSNYETHGVWYPIFCQELYMA